MSITPDFEELYRDDPDPWEVATSWYERRKTALVMALLRRERYRLAWDPACGTGDLAVELAARCDEVICSDMSPTACDLTRRALARAGAVSRAVVECAQVPAVPEALGGRHPDLVVLSEFLYYLDAGQRERTWAMLDEVCDERTDVVAVHWGPEPEQAHLSGSAAQRELNTHLGQRGWWRLVTHTDMEFLVALWSQDAPDQIGR